MSALHQLSKHQVSTYQQTARHSGTVRQPDTRQPDTKRVRKARTTPIQRQQQQQRQHRIMATEASLKLAMNAVIAGVALTTLCHIIPNRSAQHAKLEEVKTEVQVTEQRVSQLQTEFNRTFDTSQERQIAQEQTHFVDPNRTPIVWLDKKGHTTAQLPDQ